MKIITTQLSALLLGLSISTITDVNAEPDTSEQLANMGSAYFDMGDGDLPSLYSPFDLLNLTGQEFRLKLHDIELSEQAQRPLVYDIAYTKWTPWRSNGQTIIYNHGFQSHKDWFNFTAEYLSVLGYTVYAFDRIGSGHSSGGITLHTDLQSTIQPVIQSGHINNWRTWTWTLDQIVTQAHQDTPENSITIWANSFGAHIVTAYLNQYSPSNVSNAIFTTPGLFVNLPLPFTLDEFISKQPYDYFPSSIPDTEGDQGGQYFTEDPFYLWSIRHDQRSLRDVTQSFYYAVVGIGQYNLNRATISDDPLNNYSRFYLLAEQDTMMNNTKVIEYIKRSPVNAIAKFYRALDNKHFISFSSDMEQAVLDIHDFLSGRDIDETVTLEYVEQ
jgi:alpha-beta hydrolase superfamily lysophospholipase